MGKQKCPLIFHMLDLHQSPGKSMEFATISTIDLQRLEKALTPLGGLSGTVQSIRTSFKPRAKKIMPAFELIFLKRSRADLGKVVSF